MKFCFLLTLLLLVGSNKVNAQENATTLLLSLERTTCYGNCPYYKVEIYENGYAVYEGKKNTTLIGRYTTTISTQLIEQLLKKAKAINYSNLNPKYPIKGLGIIDFPVCITSIRQDGELKTIYNRNDAPVELVTYEQLFDDLVADLPWRPL